MLKKEISQGPNLILEEFKPSYNKGKKIFLHDKPVTLSSYKQINKLFKLKKTKSPIKSITYITNDSGKMRHYTPAAQEWYNSIYSYNKNYTKLLPSADKNAIKLLKSYFNFSVMHKKLKTKDLTNRYRKLSANKVFVGKGELKHVNNKILLTSYVYNAELLYLKSLVGKEARSLYYPNKDLERDVNVNVNKNKNDVITYNRPFTYHEYLNVHNNPDLPIHPLLHKEVCFKLFWKQYIKFIGMNKLKDQEKKDKEKEKKFENKHGGKEEAKFLLKSLKLNMINLNNTLHPPMHTIYSKKYANTSNLITSTNENNTTTAIDNLDYNELKFKDKIEILFYRDFSSIGNDNIYQNFILTLLGLTEEKNQEKLFKFKQQVFKIRKFFFDFDLYITVAKNNYLKKFRWFTYLLMLNTVKFKTPFASKLLRFLENIYKKKIELNIVNLNKIHLNSDIYTQVVSLKLRNRDNKLFRVLRSSLNKVNLPNVSRMTERQNKSNRDEYLINKIRNTYVNSMFNNIDVDPLNSLLLSFFSNVDNLKIDINNRSSIVKHPITLYKYIIRSLKHLKLAGIRVEAKGRLTRRFTASRSVFKVRWKGGLKNVDSSFKGLSAIMLRGDRKSNVQYSLISSKNRNGAYGVKGWVSSK